MIDYAIRCMGYSPPLWDVATAEACSLVWEKLTPETRKNVYGHISKEFNVDNAHQWLEWTATLGVDHRPILRKYFANLPQRLTEHVHNDYLRLFLREMKGITYDVGDTVIAGKYFLERFFGNWTRHINPADGPVTFLPILTGDGDFATALTSLVRQSGLRAPTLLAASELGFLARYSYDRSNRAVWEDLLCKWGQVKPDTLFSLP